MKKITALIPFLMVVFLLSCNKDDEITDLENKISELEDQVKVSELQDSLAFVLALNDQEYRKYTDSLRRADSILLMNGGNLPYSYNVLVYDGSTTSVFSDSDTRTDGSAAFDEEVTISVSQFGETRTISTSDGLASFDNIGRGIVNVSVTAADYTTLKYSFETLVDPDSDLLELYLESDTCNCTTAPEFMALWEFLQNGNIGHDVSIFATAGENASTVTGRVFVETDLTNSDPEVVPEGTVITAAIDVEDANFREEFIQFRNKTVFTDMFLSFGYDPIFKATTDANGDYSFTLAGAANEAGLPYHFEYSDFLADQTAFVEATGEVTTEAKRTAFGPELPYTEIPLVLNAASVSFSAGGGATASLDTEGDGTVIDIDVESTGNSFQGTPRVIVAAPPVGGTQALASATIDGSGRVTTITVDDAGQGYLAAPGVTVTEGTGAAASVTSLMSDGSNGGVADVLLTNGGAGYSVAPNVLFSSDVNLDSATIAQYAAANGALPTATASLNANGSISDISVTNTGSDLSATPTVIITPGFGASATVSSVDANGAITGIAVTTSGEHYTEVVTISDGSISAGAGTGANFTFGFTAGELTNITIPGGATGSGYVAGDVLNFNDAADFTTRGTAVVEEEGLSIETVAITNAGTIQADGMYYSTAPLVVFDEPQYAGPGSSRAQGVAVLGANGQVVGLTITDPGSGYTAPPNINFVSGTGAAAFASIDPFEITEVDVVASGSGYLEAPLIEIFDAGGTGSGATAVATISVDGRVTDITLTDPGTNYSNPQVVILDPGFAYDPTDGSLVADPATAEVTVTDGEITEIVMTSLGSNYPASSNILLSAGRGTGFAATLQVTGGQITGVTIDDGGEDYVGGNTPGVGQVFSGIDDSNYSAKTGITRILDILYGTGKRDGEDPL